MINICLRYTKRRLGAVLPRRRGDAMMGSYGTSSTLVLYAGFQTEWGYFSDYTKNVTDVVRNYDFKTMDPEKEKHKYYFDDLWTYNPAGIWIQHQKKSGEKRPIARK